MTDLVLLERQGQLGIVTLNRPERMNALSRDVLIELGEVGRKLVQDPEIRAVVLTGSGDRAFCAGADLKERREMSDDQIRRQLHLYESELGWLSAPHFPTIAAINGVALGGGLELALCCDLRIAVASAELGLPETSLGIIPAAGGTQRLARLVGEPRAKEMILLSQRLSAKQALAIGLVHRVVKNPAKLLPKTLEYIQPILEGAPIALRAALRAIAAAGDLPLSAGLAMERQCYELCLTSEDRKEALAAFAEKRRPNYLGK